MTRSPAIPLHFTKMHGLGNDFIVFETDGNSKLPDAAGWRALADRHTGIGFDQALVIGAAKDSAHQASYRIFNADGSEVEQCGNGARCVAEWLRRKRRLAQTEILRLESRAGVVEARFTASGLVAINMGEPRFLGDDSITLRLEDGEVRKIRYSAVSMGNPHIVLTVEDIATAPVALLGPPLAVHENFPARTNVGFLQPVDETHGKLRVFERGVGETQACGTGACAAMAVGRRSELFAAKVAMRLPGGELVLEWPGPGSPMWMTGPAEIAFEGVIGS